MGNTALRTVPPFATAHKFCASRDDPRKSGFFTRRCLLKQRYFCTVYNYAGKADLGKNAWLPPIFFLDPNSPC